MKEYQHLEDCRTPDDEFHWLNLHRAPEKHSHQRFSCILSEIKGLF